MPLTETTAANAVYLRLNAALRARLKLFDVVAQMRAARDDLALYCVREADAAAANFGFKTFAVVAVAAGVADISLYLADEEPLVAEGLPWAEVRHSDMVDDDPDMAWVNTLSELREERSKAFVHFTLDGANLKFRGRDGSLSSLDGVNVTIDCACARSVANIPRNLEEKFLDLLHARVLRAHAAGAVR